MTPNRLSRIAFGLWLGLILCAPAHAQVERLLGNVVSWILQNQIDEWDKANDTSRGLTEYNARDNFSPRDLSARDQFSPSALPKFEGSYEPRVISRRADIPRPAPEPPTEAVSEPPAQ